jgi:hypothetical protein
MGTVSDCPAEEVLAAPGESAPTGKPAGGALAIPVYLKTGEEMPWPGHEPVFYLLSRNGLFLARNHRFFSSCVPARNWPADLGPQERFLSIRAPRIPRRYLELAVGFFARVERSCGGEAALHVLWDEKAGRIRFQVPSQVAVVRRDSRGRLSPLALQYEADEPVPPGCVLLGDIHSHATSPAYCSGTDRLDEEHRPGLHIVVGCVDWEPPEFHLEYVVDGVRFEVKQEDILEGYRRRRLHVPRGWLEKVQVEVRRW